MIISFSSVYVKTYIDWQAISLKERSVQNNLSKISGIEEYTLLKIEDEFVFNELYEQTWCRWTFVFDRMNESHITYAFYEHQMPNEQILKKSLESNVIFPPYRAANSVKALLSGNRGIMTIGPGDYFLDGVTRQTSSGFRNGEWQKIRLVGKYLYYKMFEPEAMNEYLAKLTSVKLSPVNSLFD